MQYDIKDEFTRNKIEDILNRLILLEKSLSVNVLSTKYLSSNWKFKLISSTSSSSYTSTSESATTYDDSSWSTVNVPHDWSIYIEDGGEDVQKDHLSQRERERERGVEKGDKWGSARGGHYNDMLLLSR